MIVSTESAKTSLVTCWVSWIREHIWLFFAWFFLGRQHLVKDYELCHLQYICSKTCLKSVPERTIWMLRLPGQELPRAVLHMCRLQRVIERAVCLRSSQWWDCLLRMWHKEERLKKCDHDQWNSEQLDPCINHYPVRDPEVARPWRWYV